MHFFLPTYLGGTFSPLLYISERNFFPRWGGGVHVHPPVYAPGIAFEERASESLRL